VRTFALATPLLAAALLGLLSGDARAGAFLFAEQGFADTIMHPGGYDGTGGSLEVRVCIDPTSVNGGEMVLPLENIVRTLNALEPTTENVVSGDDNNIPPGQIDFESVALHELMHCIGLAHPNIGTGRGASNPDFCSSHEGPNEEWDLDPGDDDTGGSGDDERDDDVNLAWFQISNNDPFTIAPVVDTSTYSQDLEALPGDDSFAAIASREVAAVSSIDPSTEAVMHQGTHLDEAQRTLGHDDVAMLRLGMAGHDGTAGTLDDYTLALRFVGFTVSGCDIILGMDASKTGFAACQASAAFPVEAHGSIVEAFVYFDPTDDWFFNDAPNAPNAPSSLSVPSLSTVGLMALALGLLAVVALAPRCRR